MKSSIAKLVCLVDVETELLKGSLRVFIHSLAQDSKSLIKHWLFALLEFFSNLNESIGLESTVINKIFCILLTHSKENERESRSETITC